MVAIVMTTTVSFLATLLLVGTICATYAQYSFNRRYTACPPTIEQFLTAYPHPFNCRKFFYCVLGNLVEFQCPGIMHFDRYRKKCTHPVMVKCPSYPTRASTSSTVQDWVSTSLATFFPDVSERITKDTTAGNDGTKTPVTDTKITTTRTDVCGRVYYINETSGYFVSPNYPNKYMNSMDCDYNIATPPGTFLSFHINYLDLENRYDYVDIFNVTNYRRTRLTGRAKRNDIYTNSNSVRVHFHSDMTIVRSGYNISFTACVCAGQRNYSGNSGSIVIPGFPNSQNMNLDCYYNINTPPGSIVILSVRYFNVRNDNKPGQCLKDYLKIYDGPTSEYTPLATLCGTRLLNKRYYASANRVLMYYHTSNASTSLGFNISYSSIPSKTVWSMGDYIGLKLKT